jgi:holo-[acyl-carrier protein] synthase
MRIGTDLVQISRISTALDKSPGFASLVYTPAELELAESFSKSRREQFLAGRFAIKEAVAKALRLGIGDGSVLRQIEALTAAGGEPKLTLHGSALETARRLGLQDFEVSLSHEAGLVVAFAVLV